MAATSDERREMAEQLRKHNGRYYEELVNMSDSDLADLIDPTCHVVTSGEWRGRPIGSACSECHAPLYPSTEWTHGMRYCSQCGSRVVDDDD